MLKLTTGTNSSVFTLTEKFDFYNPSVTTYSNLYYTFKITNDLNGSEIYFISDDISNHPERMNKFMINVTQSNTPDLFNGQIGLWGMNDDDGSQWTYEVFGCEGPKPTSGTISVPVSGVSLERGRMIYTK